MPRPYSRKSKRGSVASLITCISSPMLPLNSSPTWPGWMDGEDVGLLQQQQALPYPQTPSFRSKPKPPVDKPASEEQEVEVEVEVETETEKEGGYLDPTALKSELKWTEKLMVAMSKGEFLRHQRAEAKAQVQREEEEEAAAAANGTGTGTSSDNHHHHHHSSNGSTQRSRHSKSPSTASIITEEAEAEAEAAANGTGTPSDNNNPHHHSSPTQPSYYSKPSITAAESEPEAEAKVEVEHVEEVVEELSVGACILRLDSKTSEPVLMLLQRRGRGPPRRWLPGGRQIFPLDDDIFSLRHGNGDENGQDDLMRSTDSNWELPGGMVADDDVSISTALAKRVKEATGLQVVKIMYKLPDVKRSTGLKVLYLEGGAGSGSISSGWGSGSSSCGGGGGGKRTRRRASLTISQDRALAQAQAQASRQALTPLVVASEWTSAVDEEESYDSGSGGDEDHVLYSAYSPASFRSADADSNANAKDKDDGDGNGNGNKISSGDRKASPNGGEASSPTIRTSLSSDRATRIREARQQALDILEGRSSRCRSTSLPLSPPPQHMDTVGSGEGSTMTPPTVPAKNPGRRKWAWNELQYNENQVLRGDGGGDWDAGINNPNNPRDKEIDNEGHRSGNNNDGNDGHDAERRNVISGEYKYEDEYIEPSLIPAPLKLRRREPKLPSQTKVEAGVGPGVVPRPLPLLPEADHSDRGFVKSRVHDYELDHNRGRAQPERQPWAPPSHFRSDNPYFSYREESRPLSEELEEEIQSQIDGLTLSNHEDKSQDEDKNEDKNEDSDNDNDKEEEEDNDKEKMMSTAATTMSSNRRNGQHIPYKIVRLEQMQLNFVVLVDEEAVEQAILARIYSDDDYWDGDDDDDNDNNDDGNDYDNDDDGHDKNGHDDNGYGNNDYACDDNGYGNDGHDNDGNDDGGNDYGGNDYGYDEKRCGGIYDDDDYDVKRCGGIYDDDDYDNGLAGPSASPTGATGSFRGVPLGNDQPGGAPLTLYDGGGTDDIDGRNGTNNGTGKGKENSNGNGKGRSNGHSHNHSRSHSNKSGSNIHSNGNRNRNGAEPRTLGSGIGGHLVAQSQAQDQAQNRLGGLGIRADEYAALEWATLPRVAELTMDEDVRKVARGAHIWFDSHRWDRF
ncbi:hypothetical protein F4808DRAFT_464128 [Astrocystis sublimbata]|nr:hypothetical protein F4808DRAFT_464128 [Astrocystis sublimbata]